MSPQIQFKYSALSTVGFAIVAAIVLFGCGPAQSTHSIDLEIGFPMFGGGVYLLDQVPAPEEPVHEFYRRMENREVGVKYQRRPALSDPVIVPVSNCELQQGCLKGYVFGTRGGELLVGFSQFHVSRSIRRKARRAVDKKTAIVTIRFHQTESGEIESDFSGIAEIRDVPAILRK